MIVIALASCQRNVLPPSFEEQPVFSASGTLDGEEFIVAAGVNNYYLEPTYERNESGVFEFVADFKKNNGDAGQFSVSILDSEPRLPFEDVMVDAAVMAGSYDFQTEPIELEEWTYKFYSFAGDNVSYDWTINGNNTTDLYPVIVIEESADLNVDLIIENELTGCTDSLSLTHELDEDASYYNYYYKPFEWTYVNEFGGVLFEYKLDDEADVNWIIEEDGQLITGSGTEIAHTFLSNGPHKVIMNVVLSDGFHYRYAENISAIESEATCAASIHYEPVPVAFEVSKVRIDYTDDNGTMFSSLREQGEEADGTFDIVSVEEFYDDQQMISTRKIEVLMNCTLYEIGNESNSLVLEDFVGTMAVSFPQ